MKESYKEWIYILILIVMVSSSFMGEPIRYIVPIIGFIIIIGIKVFIPVNQENKD